MKKLKILSSSTVDIYGYDQNPNYYSIKAIGEKIVCTKIVDGKLELPKTPEEIKRFNDVKVGDKLYSVSVGKIIEYEVTKINREQVNVISGGGWRGYKEIGTRTLVTFTYKIVGTNRTGTINMFEEQICADTWSGFTHNFNGFSITKTDQRMIYPNTAEPATENKIFASKEACMYYLQNLYKERMCKVKEMMKKVDEQMHFANEYTPALQEWGWDKEKVENTDYKSIFW